MLNRLMKKNDHEDKDKIFPQPKAEKNLENKFGGEKKIFSPADLQELHDLLINNTEFLEKIKEAITQNILNTLQEKYDFTPTDKYLQKENEKKQYLNQLDSYLEERKMINHTVNNDLQAFLKTTTDILTEKLDSFSLSINQKIIEAEQKYGIDKLKDMLNESPEGK